MKVHLRNPNRTVELPGPAPVARVLEQLSVNPETVLVITEGTLVTKDFVLPDDAEVELRPVISGGAGPGRCHACPSTAVLEIPRNHAAYCAEHFVDHVRAQLREAIDRHHMLSYDDRILVAVSGGKDSLALWDVLLDMGYRADGLYLGLGIGGYSDRSADLVRAYAARRGATLQTVDLAEHYGYDILQASTLPNRSACGVCGLSKRYVFNRIAVEHGYDVMATGHNLDDEAATLLGNVLRWQSPFLARQSVCLPARPAREGNADPPAREGNADRPAREGNAARPAPEGGAGTDGGMIRKVKPLYRLGERETAAYCVLKGIDYVVEECPLVAGNTVLRYKDALNELERHSPGTKAAFLFGFLDRAQAAHFAGADEAGDGLVACARCGMPTATSSPSGTPTCAFCRTQARLLARLARPAREASPRAVSSGREAGGRGAAGP